MRFFSKVAAPISLVAAIFFSGFTTGLADADRAADDRLGATG